MFTSTPPSDPFSHLSPEDRQAALNLLRVQLARRRRRAAEEPATKRCPTCATDLPLTAFAKDCTRHDGLRGQCRECGRLAREEKKKKR